MLITFFCPKCLPLAEGEGPEAGPLQFYALPFSDSGLYRWTCDERHNVVVGLQADRFEMLFEIAIQALADGYARESVVTAAAALERFYEYYVRIIWEARSVGKNLQDLLWKTVRKSSERQLGLFSATYALETGEAPPLLDEKTQVSFRNQVVHQGLIPSEIQAVDFAQGVANLIHPIFLDVISRHSQAATTIDVNARENAERKLSPGEEITTWWGARAFPISRHRRTLEPCDVAAEVRERKRRRLRAVAM